MVSYYPVYFKPGDLIVCITGYTNILTVLFVLGQLKLTLPLTVSVSITVFTLFVVFSGKKPALVHFEF